MIQYETYRLSRILTVQGIISADLVKGIHPPVNSHMHQDAWELCCCLEQNVWVAVEDHRVSLQNGQLLLTPPGVHHDVVLDHKDSLAFVIAFSCSNSENLRPLQDTVFHAEEALLFLFQQIISELDSTFIHDANTLHLYRFHSSEDSPLGAEQLICSYLEQILISLLRKATMHKGEIVRSGKFREAIHTYLAEQITAFIREHIGETLTVALIAEHFHYSRARLSTIYKSVTGYGINETITRERMQQARQLLLQQEKTVTQISDELGFSSPQYFSQKFFLETGCPPSRYAEVCRKSPKSEPV